MGSPNSTQSLSAAAPAAWSDVPTAELDASLERVLESPQFRSSRKCSRFLRHIVVAARNHHLDCLKERTLGVDVFDRDPQYDTNQDPIVRGTAGEVRKRLAQYYLETGVNDTYRFSLPLGSYIPEVHRVAALEPGPAPAVDSHMPVTSTPALPVSPARRRKRRNWLWPAAAVAALAALIAAACVIFFHFRPTPLGLFWAPVLNSPDPALVCMGQPQLYTFHPDTARVLNSWFAANQQGKTPPIASVPTAEIVPMWSETVSLSDSQAYSRIANFFAHGRKQLDLRGERRVSLTDLRRRPSIFIGAFDNPWTLNLEGELRYYFDQSADTHRQIIRDRQRPSRGEWTLIDPWPPTDEIQTDYALVSRVLNPTTEQTIIMLAGISEYGTSAAAEFVTNPEYFQQALTTAPSDWYKKNIQVVLSTRVISRTGGPPTVVAVYFW